MCRHYTEVLSQEHRHHIESTDHDNCVLCLIDAKGPMTQEEIGSYFGVTKEWIAQIERLALKKIKRRMIRQLRDTQYVSLDEFLPNDSKCYDSPGIRYHPAGDWTKDSGIINHLHKGM